MHPHGGADRNDLASGFVTRDNAYFRSGQLARAMQHIMVAHPGSQNPNENVSWARHGLRKLPDLQIFRGAEALDNNCFH